MHYKRTIVQSSWSCYWRISNHLDESVQRIRVSFVTKNWSVGPRSRRQLLCFACSGHLSYFCFYFSFGIFLQHSPKSDWCGQQTPRTMWHGTAFFGDIWLYLYSYTNRFLYSFKKKYIEQKGVKQSCILIIGWRSREICRRFQVDSSILLDWLIMYYIDKKKGPGSIIMIQKLQSSTKSGSTLVRHDS